MRTELFNKVVEAAVDRSLSMMARKNNEYSGNADYDSKSKANDDRLRGCKSVAEIQGVNIFRAIGGMMAKHTSSVYDLIRDTESGEVADMSVWQEKITDHINYLLLLEAAVRAQHDHTEENLANGVDPDRGFKKFDGQPEDLNAITINHFHGHPGHESAGRGFYMEEEALQRSQSRRLRDEREGK